MNKLYFRYGTMGSSKSAQLLVCKYNYEEKGYNVLLLKPSIDNRDTNNGKIVVKSRIGLEAPCVIFSPTDSIINIYQKSNAEKKVDVILVDEINFATAIHVEELKHLSQFVPVLMYGLKNDFTTHLFEGSKRALELADDILEIKSICKCGRKATENMRRINGVAVDYGPTILVGGNDTYESVCFWCYKEAIKKGKQKKE